MARKAKTFGVNVPVPQSRDEAADAVCRIGEANREIARIEADMNDKISALKSEGEKASEPHKSKVVELTEGLKTWAEAHRDELTGQGRTKTADLGTGKLMWRLRPPSVRIVGVDRVIEAIKAMGLDGFLRVKEEVNKEALLAAPDKARMLAGVSIGSEGEDFFVEPFEASISAGATTGAAA
jgi:phage host-nuclease inhibitor protein Gam